MPILIAILGLLTLRLTYTLDPDLGWHLYLGQYMASHHALVTNLVGYNVFQHYTLIDHEWLSDLILHFLYVHVGYGSLIWLAFGLNLIVVWLAYRVCRNQGASQAATVLAGTLLLIGLGFVYGVRVQLLLPLGVGVLLAIWRSPYTLVWRCVLYFLTFLIGDNLHGGFVLMAAIPLIMELSLFEKGVAFFSSSKRYLGILLSIGAGLVINPYGIAFWSLVKDYIGDTSYRLYIQEWHPLFISTPSFIPGQLAFMVALFFLLYGSFWQKTKPVEWLLIAFLALLSLRYARFLPCFLMASVPYLARSFDQFLIACQKKSIYRYFAVALMLVPGIVFVATPISWANITIHPDPRQAQGYPVGAMSVLARYPACQDHIFNPYGWGGYMVGFFPSEQVFIDGRGPQLEITPGVSLIDVYEHIVTGSPNQVETLFNTYDIQCVLVEKNSDTQSLPEDLTLDWHQVYNDPLSQIYVRS